MESIKIQGCYEGNNFIVDSIAKYIRENNYPQLKHQVFDIIPQHKELYDKQTLRLFNYMVSNDDSYVNAFLEDTEKTYSSLGVLYRVDSGLDNFFMVIDGHYYWATC